MKTLNLLNVKGGVVLLRADFNVPLQDGRICDDFRVRAVLPTIEHLRAQGACVAILSHLGRPDGKKRKEFSLWPVVQLLSTLGNFPVRFEEDLMDPELGGRLRNLGPGAVVMLENLRFYPGEEQNDLGFAEHLAKLGDFYVNDAFGVAHRAHASQVHLPKLLPSAAGLLLEREVRELEHVRMNPEHPLVIIMGGAKVQTKVKVISSFMKKADAICLGGVIANAVLVLKGFSVGKSVTGGNLQSYADSISMTDNVLHLPLDVIVSSDATGAKSVSEKAIANVAADEMILDIGPETRLLFARIVKEAKMVVWNGPLGLLEVSKFAEGTRNVIAALKETDAYVVVGGGDVIRAINEAGAQEFVDFTSTGGGAMLEYLAGDTLPGVAALAEN